MKREFSPPTFCCRSVESTKTETPSPSKDPPIVKYPLMFISTFFADFVALNLRFVLFLWNVTHIQSLRDLFYDPVIHKGILLSLPKHQASRSEIFQMKYFMIPLRHSHASPVVSDIFRQCCCRLRNF